MTDEIRDIRKQVAERQGWVRKHGFWKHQDPLSANLICPRDIREPAVWAPLLEEMRAFGIVRVFCYHEDGSVIVDLRQEVLGAPHNLWRSRWDESHDADIDTEIGIAIALCWLAWKEAGDE